MHETSYNEMSSVLRRYTEGFTDRNLKVVDVGSLDVNGTYKKLIPAKWQYTGVDIIAGKNVDIVMETPYKLPFADNSTNIVISGQCLEHVDRPWILTKEIARILDPGGFCFLTCPAKFHLHSYPYDYWRIYPEGMRVLLQDSGFKVLEVYTNPVDGLLEKNYGNPWTVDCWGIGIKK